MSSADGEAMLAGHRREITAMFCDLRNFTGFSETAEPEEVLGFLRAYHAAMGRLIVEHEGTLEHFAGDGFMTFFNDPVIQPDHAARAIGMAVAMRDRFAPLSEDWRRRGHVLELGIGIATGYATLGRIGFEGRYDYGAIGNVIILASRLSSEAAPGEILVSQRTYAQAEPLVVASPRASGRSRGSAGRCRPTRSAGSCVRRPAHDARPLGDGSTARDHRRRRRVRRRAGRHVPRRRGDPARGAAGGRRGGRRRGRGAPGALAQVEQHQRRRDAAGRPDPGDRDGWPGGAVPDLAARVGDVETELAAVREALLAERAGR